MVEEIKADQGREEQVRSQHQQEGENGQEAAAAGQETAQADEEQVAPGPSAEALHEEIESLKQQAADHLDKALRAQAEMENLRKRSAREVENAHKYGMDRFIRELLPVIDSMELGISASDNSGDITGLREGMDLTLKKFLDVLNKSGVEVIDPQGEKFNPELHEAVSVQAADSGQAGTVIAVMQKGYSLNGRLVRPAMVVVAQ